jgi:hypothetical protein
MSASDIATIVKELQQAHQQFHRLQFDQDHPQALGPPCSAQQLARLAQVFGGNLPPSYRAFMALHNGWAGFSGGAKILAAEDYDSGWVKARLAELNENLHEFGSGGETPIDRNCIPIYLGETEMDFALIDPSTRGPDGEMTVLGLDLEVEGENRFADFSEFLRSHLATTKTLIDGETSGKQP